MPLDRLNGPVGNGRGTSSTGDHAHHSSHGTHGLMQLCVIVEKDEIGYGLTVSGDKPVHVQSVKENGASAKAGVRTGDRIYKVNGASVANFDHTEVVNLIKAGSHVALTLLRKPEKDHQKVTKTPTLPGAFSISSNRSGGGSDRITHPIPADAQQEQLVAKERIDTVRKMFDEAVATENKLQQEYSRSKSHKSESKLQDAKKTTGAIRKQLESLTEQTLDMRNASNRNSVCLGDVQSTSSSDTMQSPAVSMPASVDSPDSTVIRSPAPSTIGEFPVTTSPASDTDEESTSYSRMSSSEHRNSIGFGRISHNTSSEIFSMDDDDFSPESQTVVKDHGPFIDFELLRNRHAHCSVFLSFLVSNADPAPMLFTLASELYMTGSAKDMRRWAYEIHSTFIVKDAPLAIKLEDSVIETIEMTLKTNPEREDYWKNLFNASRTSAAEDITAALADFRLKRELGLGNFFGDGDLRDDIDKATELRIIEKTLKPHYDKYANDESPRSQAMSISLATVMKEWGVHKGGIDRQVSFAMKDYNKSSFKSVLGSKFNKKQKETKNHQFTPHMYQATTFCDHCATLIWGIGYQGYICSNCEMNIHKECINHVESCSKKKKKKRSSIIPKQMMKSTSTSSTSSAAMLSEDMRETPSAVEEEPTVHSVAALKERFESSSQANTNGEQPKSNIVGRSESFNKKSESIKSKDGRRAKSDVDKDGGEKILTAIDQSRSSSSASSLSNRSDSSSTERVNDLSMKPAPIDEECDSDLEVEESMPPLDGVIRKELLRKMKPKEKKRQEVINELLYTERSHVRNLKLLDKLFHKPMARADFCSKELVELVFPSIKSLIEIHVQLNDELKSKMKEDPLVPIKDVANILLSRFDSEAGEKMKEVCALFCRNHTYAINALKDKRKRDGKLQELLSAAETNPMCRRLQFKDLIIIEVHRLTKYPLLIDSMYNHTTSQSEEHKMLARAYKCSRAILENVNHAVKECENHHKLVALQKRLDTKPIQNSANPLVANYKNLNLQDYKLVYEGALSWRLSANRTKQIELHVVLLEEMLVLLQVQDDGKLVLKCQSQIATQSREDSKFGHSPIITLNSMLVRQVATDKKAIFIINTSQLGPQIYDLIANSVEEKKRWFKYISDAADSQRKSHTSRRAPVNKSNLTLTEVSSDESVLQDKFVDAFTPDAIKTNNNITSDTYELSTPSARPKLLNDCDNPLDKEEEEEEDGGGLSTEHDLEVSTSETTLQDDDDDDGERDPKSLVLASISDTMLLKQFLSAASTTAAYSAALSNSATPAPPNKLELSPSSTTPEQTLSVLNTLSKRLNSLLEVVEERDNERVRLQHQLHTAEQLLKDSPSKESGDSRPNSFVSNSSSNASVGEASDSQINAMTTNPVIPSVIQRTESLHSEPITPYLNDSTSNSSSQAESDSDDEGTVYADTKEDINEGHDEIKQRPDSSMSDISNTHTDNTLISNDNLSDDMLECNNQGSSSDLTSDCITASAGDSSAVGAMLTQIEVNIQSASSSADSDSDIEIEKTNIDDIVSTPPGIHIDAVGDSCTDNEVINVPDSTISVAASMVEQAIKAAMDILRVSTLDNNEINNTGSSSVTVDSATTLVDCNNIEVDFISETEVYRNVEGGGGDIIEQVLIDKTSDDIDDSDEADALSASSLD